MALQGWRFYLKLAWQDAFIKWVFLSSCLLYIIVSSFFLLKLIPEGIRIGVLIMHYTIYLGIDDVRDWKWIFIFPSLMLFVLLINTSFSVSIFHRDKLASRTIMALTLVTTILWTVGSFFMIIINR